LTRAAERHDGFRSVLEDIATRSLVYKYDGNVDDLPVEKRHFLSDTYKRQLLRGMSANELLNILLIQPTVMLREAHQNGRLKVTGVMVRHLSFCFSLITCISNSRF
jgi:hypothetical protein